MKLRRTITSLIAATREGRGERWRQRPGTPPRQVLYGRGFILHFNPDSAPAWKCVRIVRRAHVRTVGGVVTTDRAELVIYEIYVDGAIYRVRPGERAKEVPDRHAEWKWARATLAAIHRGVREGRRPSTPPDFVRWRIAFGSRKDEWTGSPIATLRGE